MNKELELAAENAELSILRKILVHVIDTPCERGRETCPKIDLAFEEMQGAVRLLRKLSQSVEPGTDQTLAHGFEHLALAAARGELAGALVRKAHAERSASSGNQFGWSLSKEIEKWIALDHAEDPASQIEP